jgi:hypothetical protein
LARGKRYGDILIALNAAGVFEISDAVFVEDNTLHGKLISVLRQQRK